MVIITVGKICSGKSTWAKSQKEFFVFSIDELLLTIFDGCLQEKHQKTVNKIQNFYLMKILELVNLGVSVIIDDGFYEYERRKEVVSYLTANHIEVKIKYFLVDDIERENRLLLRNEKNKNNMKRHFSPSLEKMKKLDSLFEELRDSEKEYLV